MRDRLMSIGVDLAWSDIRSTGLCAAVGNRVIDSTAVRTDSEVVDWIRPRLTVSTIVAIDAPLVVTNSTGQRVAEHLVSVLFGAAGASAHSTNLSRPAFVEGGRAARIAKQLGLSIDPMELPAIIEVYPHPALVALFNLPTVLRYKRKAGRSVADRVREFHNFVRLLESLVRAEPALDVSTAPRWETIRNGLAAAMSHAALNRLEDEIDAYVCAYVGLYWLRWREERSAVLGSVADGYIVTPLDPGRVVRYRAILAMSSAGGRRI